MNRRDFLKRVGLVTASGLVLPYVPKIVYFDMGKNIKPAFYTDWAWQEIATVETCYAPNMFTVIYDSCLPSRDRDTLENQMMKRFGINKNQVVL